MVSTQKEIHAAAKATGSTGASAAHHPRQDGRPEQEGPGTPPTTSAAGSSGELHALARHGDTDIASWDSSTKRHCLRGTLLGGLAELHCTSGPANVASLVVRLGTVELRQVELPAFQS